MGDVAHSWGCRHVIRRTGGGGGGPAVLATVAAATHWRQGAGRPPAAAAAAAACQCQCRPERDTGRQPPARGARTDLCYLSPGGVAQ